MIILLRIHASTNYDSQKWIIIITAINSSRSKQYLNPSHRPRALGFGEVVTSIELIRQQSRLSTPIASKPIYGGRQMILIEISSSLVWFEWLRTDNRLGCKLLMNWNSHVNNSNRLTHPWLYDPIIWLVRIICLHVTKPWKFDVLLFRCVFVGLLSRPGSELSFRTVP